VHRLTLPGIGHYYAPLEHLVDFITAWFVPITLCLSGIVLLAIKKAFLIQPQDRFLFFSTGALLFSIGASYVAHMATGLLYPILRTGLPWIVFFLLTCLSLVKKPALRWPMLIFLLACSLWFAFELNANQYSEWSFDAGTKRIVTLLRNQHQAEPDKNWQVGVSVMLLPSMNFYKSLYHLNWFEPVDTRTGTDGLTRFVLVDKDVQLVQTMGLHTIDIDPVSNQVVATR
jgi:membrane-bound metal-dependent hydrolase YbcI (DUF457 family)